MSEELKELEIRLSELEELNAKAINEIKTLHHAQDCAAFNRAERHLELAEQAAIDQKIHRKSYNYAVIISGLTPLFLAIAIYLQWGM